MSQDSKPNGESTGGSSRSPFGERRKFLKGTTVGLGTLLAGCSDIGGGGITNGDGEQRFSGISVEYWDVINVQSQRGTERMQEFFENFQNDTGAKVNVNYSGYESMSGQEWVSAWRNEEYPVAWNGEDFYFGRIIPTGNIKPFDDYKDQIDDDAIDGMDWAMDLKRDAYRFWDIEGETGILNFPHGAGIRNGVATRTDILEEAGYSIDDIPRGGNAVENWEGLMELARDVQENSSARWGFYAHGQTFDYNDNLCPWMASENAEASRYISEDGTEAYPGESSDQIWSRWLKRMRNTQEEQVGTRGVSGPETPTISDEEVAQQMIAGDVAFANFEPLNFPTWIRRGREHVEEGTFKYLPYPRGNSDTASVHVGFHDSGINKAPSNADAERWDRKTDVAIAIHNRIMSEQFQSDYTNIIGWMGINQNQWENTEPIGGEGTQIKDTLTSELVEADITWPYHRFSNSIMFTEIAPPLQEALGGNRSPEDAMAAAKEAGDGLAQDAIDEFGEVGTWPVN